MKKPLILITRPAQDARPLAKKLARRGFAILSQPLLKICLRTPLALPKGKWQAVLLTSANAARALEGEQWESLKRLPLLAAGSAGKAAARKSGFQHAFAPQKGAGAAALIALIRQKLRPENGPLLHLSGKEIAVDLAPPLAASGFLLKRLVVYEARPAPRLAPRAARALREKRLSFALFFSPRSAQIFADLVKNAGLASSLSTVSALCLSPAIAQNLNGLPFAQIKAAPLPEENALLGLLANMGHNDPLKREKREKRRRA